MCRGVLCMCEALHTMASEQGVRVCLEHKRHPCISHVCMKNMILLHPLHVAMPVTSGFTTAAGFQVQIMSVWILMCQSSG